VRPRRLTLDLDAAWCYRAIHGVDVDSASDVDDRAVDVDDDGVLVPGFSRFLDLCARLGAKATLFVVTRDLASPRYAGLVNAAAAAGHDVESHSHRHHYDLSRRPAAAIRKDLDDSVRAIVDVTGRAPVGFRAPGYNLSPALTDAVKDAGFAYSSSILPSPLYFGARAAVIAKTRLGGRRSASLVGDARAFSPLLRRTHKHENGLVEHPMSAPYGVPFTGTLLALLPDVAVDVLVDAVAADPDGQLELHAADFVDGRALPAAQPDAHVRLADKLRRIERACAALAEA
jgi:hypothetical protein